MTDNLLTLAGVHTHIEQYHILQGVDLAVPKGGITMLLGRNGAGKTTTMRTIMGLWQASKGSIHFDGQDITRYATPDVAQSDIAYVPENMGIFGSLSVAENMRLAHQAKTMPEDRLDWIFGFFPALKKFWNWPAGNLSGGQKQMLAIARAIIEPKRLILIDEPTKGLAPAIVDALTHALKELKATETSILLVEQNFRMAKNVGDTVAVMDDGRVVHTGLMSELAEDTDLQTRLLGLSLEAHQ